MKFKKKVCLGIYQLMAPRFSVQHFGTLVRLHEAVHKVDRPLRIEAEIKATAKVDQGQMSAWNVQDVVHRPSLLETASEIGI